MKKEKVDFGRTADDYARYRAGFPPSLFERLAIRGIGLPAQRVLDLGTGTGTLARGFARRGCEVSALDPSAELMAQARRLDLEAGVQIEYRQATAEETGFEDAGFDVVCAGQCWHWFKRSKAAAEASRILRPGGILLMAHFDWLPLPGNVVEAAEQLVLAHNPEWRGHSGTGAHPKWFADLAVAGFQSIESFSFDESVVYSHEAWRGRIRASAGVAASLDAADVARFDAGHAALLRDRFPQDPLRIPHRVFAVYGRKPNA